MEELKFNILAINEIREIPHDNDYFLEVDATTALDLNGAADFKTWFVSDYLKLQKIKDRGYFTV